MIPSRALVIAFLVPTLLSIATVWKKDVLLPILGVDAAIIALALFDRLLSRAPDLELTISGRRVLSIGENNPVTLQFSLRGRKRLKLLIKPNLPPEIVCNEFAQSKKPFSLIVKRGDENTLKYHLVPSKRGEFRLESHSYRTTSRLGLWTIQRRIGEERVLKVYPDLAMIRTYELLARQQRQHALVRATKMRGGESEFARLRDYTRDDDTRFIDWKATARRNKLTSREFQLESDQNVFFALDAGRLMTADVKGLSQFDHALNATLLFAHVAARGGDRVGLMVFDESVRSFLLPKGGPKAASRLVRETYGIHPRLSESAFQKAMETFDFKMKQRSLMVLFTQLIDDTAVEELTAQLRYLSRKHLPLVIILEDTDLTHQASKASGAETTERELYERGAAAELLLWKSAAIQSLKRAGAHVIETPVASLNDKVINRYLEIKAHGAL